MNIDELLVEMIHHARNMNHKPTRIILGSYMLKELEKRARDMVTHTGIDKNHCEFMGLEIEESARYPFIIGVS